MRGGVTPPPLVETIGRAFDLPEQVIDVFWIGDRALFATGDGSVRAHDGGGEAWTREGVHDGALLTACPGLGEDILTGGDDGRVAAVDATGEVTTLGAFKGRWIEALAASRTSRLAAVGVGKEVAILGTGGEKHRFAHDATVTGLAFEPNGRRFAAAHYGGVTVSWAASPESRRKKLDWKGAHLSVVWTHDAKFIVTTMQEQALHGWRLQDGQHFRMAGYPAKIRALSFTSDNRWLASAGAQEVVLWPFQGANGPIGSNAAVAGELATPCTAVRCHPDRAVLAAGGMDGELILLPVANAGAGPSKALLIDPPHGARVTALAWSADGRRLAFGCENGRAGVLDFTDAL
ncbi:MAG: WD40 repeat domain-containing protein [Hyphomonadaceae bacterium]|nr:WD40 repeat domain-containing protein [Hyphomonadaceae bacterium]